MLPVVAGLCASGFVRLQSGTKLPLASVHVRVTDGLANAAAVPPGNAERRVRSRSQVADAGALQVLADVDLQRRLAVAEDVIRGAEARRDVVVAGHAVGPREAGAGEEACSPAASTAGNQLHGWS